MKALFLYGAHSGRGRFLKKIPKLLRTLRPLYEVFEEHYCATEDEMEKKALELGERFDALLFAGGDGTFDLILNAVMRLQRPPILGYLPAGTLNDVGKNLGVRRHLHKALKVIRRGIVRRVDIVRANDRYFAYMCALGQFSDIAYETKRKAKKRSGRNAYYSMAFKEAFQKRIVHADVIVDGQKHVVETPFLLVLNGRHVGGFKVNPRGSMTDGRIELFHTRPGGLNGLLHYFFHWGVTRLSGKSFLIRTKETSPWCFDGEKGSAGDLELTCLPGRLRIFGRPSQDGK